MVNESERLTEKQQLLELLSPGDTVYTVLRNVSRSGMSRSISLYVFKDNEPRMMDYAASILLDHKLDKHEGVKIGGCGMDMGFALVYALSRVLYGDGYALKHRWL